MEALSTHLPDDRGGEKPAANRLSYGIAHEVVQQWKKKYVFYNMELEGTIFLQHFTGHRMKITPEIYCTLFLHPR
jgi:hypothetical protein